MRPAKLTTAQEQILKDQVITADQPGSVLHDFGMLLSALEPDGFEAGGKNHLIPLKLIGELDQRLRRPLKLRLKRPQLRSHPYLQALNLLLRASGLGRVEQTGTKARLCLNPAMKLQWDQLNPTEQYFNLLEAAFEVGRAEMVGERSGFQEELLGPCLIAWKDTPSKGLKFKLDRPDNIYVSGVSRNWYLLALLDLFGLMTVEHPRPPINSWQPAGLRHNAFGDAVLTLLAGNYLDSFYDAEVDEEHGEEVDEEDREEVDEEDQDEVDEEDEEEDQDEEDRETPPEPDFGVWQPLFQPFFPEWQRNLEFPSEEPRDGMFIFHISLGKVWRLIAIPSDFTLADLADAILDSVNFDDDHLYEFTYRDRLGANCSIHHSSMDEAPWADEVTVGELPLDLGQTMTFLFDFGDSWRFDVKLERIEPRGRQDEPRIVESHGEAPPQYPSWDE
jgi:hypothetical protein